MVEEIAPGLRMHHFREVTSTMDEAALLAEAGAPEGTLVVADHQQGGRGRRGRTWSSPYGNLYLTYLTRPRISLEQASQLSLVACVGVGEALKDLLPDPRKLSYKWPNDLLLDGLKVAGVLLETVTKSTPPYLDAVLIGVGVNLVTSPPNGRIPATSFEEAGVGGQSLTVVLQKIALSLQRVLKLYAQEGFEPVRDLWMEGAHGLQRPVSIHQGDRLISGVFQGIDGAGALQLLGADGNLLAISAGDVIYGDVHSLSLDAV